MGPLKLLWARLWHLDPGLVATGQRTEKMQAVVNGDAKWMLTCKPKFEEPTIQCDDGNIYKKVAK